MSKSLDRVGSSSTLNGSLYASTVLSVESDNVEDDYEEPLNDQQWILQRKKIGLSRRNIRIFQRASNDNTKRQNEASFLKSFQRKECVRFVPDPQSRGRPMAAGPGEADEKACYCGAPRDLHKSRVQFKMEGKKFMMQESTIVEEDEESISLVDEKLAVENMKKMAPAIYVVSPVDTPKVTNSNINLAPSGAAGPEWNPSNDIHEFPTNAFGLVYFSSDEDQGSSQPSKYVRVSDNTSMSKIHSLLVDYWGVLKPRRPHLAISLIGGAKNFKMEGRKKEIFKNGLISAAKSTNALILTGGTNAGTMKLVGDAVRHGQFYVQDGNNRLSRGIKLIGLTPWGYIKNFETLINADTNAAFETTYNPNIELVRGDNVPINGDHTNFIFIDDGAKYKWNSGGSYTKFITRFELMIREMPPNGLGIPIVTLLLEGGYDAIRIIKERLREGIAAVVIEGSGRAADIIAYAYKNATKTDKGKYSLKEGHIKRLMNMLELAYGAFYKTEQEKVQGLKSIMNWVLECVHYSDILTTFDIRRETQLDKKILSALLKGQKMELQHQLYLAMVWDRVDLAEEKIFIHGSHSMDSLNKEDSLDEIMLQSLLLQRQAFIELLVVNGFVMKHFLTVEKLALLYNSGTKTFKELHVQLKEFCGINTRELYLRHIHKLLQFMIKEHRDPYYQLHRPKMPPTSLEILKKTFDEPYHELFLWAILTGKVGLVEYFWKKIQSPLLGAIIAGSIYSKLARFYKNQKSATVLQDLKQNFTDKVNELMELAISTDVNKGTSILERRHGRWGDRSLMELSFIGHLRSVIANRSCQMVVSQAWRRGFVKLHPLMCLLGLFLPFLVWTPLVRFQPGLGDNGGSLNPAQKIFVFYKCPIVKYTGLIISYFVFIILYSYVILFGFRWRYQIPEVVLYVWILILAIGEVRELCKEPSKRFKGKLRDYLASAYNKLDTLFIFLVSVAFVLRQFQVTFWYARIIMAINCAMYYIRTFRLYHASQALGPKLVIFNRMIPEIVTFLMLLIVFILAYGVAVQALIDPYRELGWEKVGSIIQDIIFLPYWQMYGELSLEDIQVVDSTGCQDPANDDLTIAYCEAEAPDLYNIRNSRTITNVLLAIYLLIGNVMLLNLLIAIFTSVFDEVQANSNEVWKWEMYRLCTEYDGRPGLAPPIMLFEDIFRLMKFIWKHTCRRKRENLDAYVEQTVAMLKLFEKDLMDHYHEDQEKKKDSTVDSRLQHLEKKTDQLLEMFEDAPDDNANWGEVVETGKKYYKTESDGSSSESEDEAKTRLTQPQPVSRAQTAKVMRMNHEVLKDLNQVRDQVEQLELRRSSDIQRLEKKLSETSYKLDQILKHIAK